MTRTSDWSERAGRTGLGDQLHDMWRTRPVRLPQQGHVAGVAAGFGVRYNIDPVVVRVAFVVSALFGGAGIVLYLLAWLLLSQQGDQTSAAESLFGKGQSSQGSSKTVVLLVALGIAITTVGPVGVGLGGSGAISFALMLAGWWLLHQRQPQPPAAQFEYPMPDALGGYPNANSPYWTGYPGTSGPFETYGPYTKLPDSYEPDPNREQPRANPAAAQQSGAGAHPAAASFAHGTAVGDGSELPTEVLRKSDASATPDTTTDHDTAVLAVNPATAQDLPAADADPGITAETVVLRKPGTDEPKQSAKQDDSPHRDPSDDPSAGGDSENPSGDGSAPGTDAPAGDRTGSSADTGAPLPVLRKTPALHPIPSATERPYAPVGPAPISPDFGPTPPGWDPLGVAPLAWDLPEPGPAQRHPVQAPPRAPRSRLTPVIIGLSLLAAAAAGSAAAAGVDWMTPGRIGAAALAVLSLGLIVGAFLRRGFGLMVLLAPLAGFVILASLIGPIQFDQGAMGDRSWAATGAADLQPEYHVSMGSATLDLTNLALTEDRATTVSVRMGDARVLIPENLRVHTTCNVRMGDTDGCVGGITGPATGPTLNLTIDVQMGSAEVKRG
ncbi:PspC domain-containing protein [Nocardia sp. NPDC005978]|uniref:PspC domain-containing protein n=1 Tax=Nocardia sp. NPDC005978 TaxID=3156725 RepID=UPI0033BEF1CD